MTPRALVLVAVVQLALAGAAVGQTDPSDPRYVEDPRSGNRDPRAVRDPREPEETKLEPTHPQFTELAEGGDLFDGLYETGNEASLGRFMQEQSWELTAYIESQCEDYVELVETGGLKSEEGRLLAQGVEKKLRTIARIADTSTGDTRFRMFVERVLSWTRDEHERFRQSQTLQKAGRARHESAVTPEDALSAMTPLRQALDMSRQLGDTPSQATALRRMGAIQLENRLYDDAQGTLLDAIRIGREVRDLDTVWDGLTGLFRTSMNRRDFDAARTALQDQYDLALEMRDEETQQQVLSRLVQLESFTRSQQP